MSETAQSSAEPTTLRSITLPENSQICPHCLAILEIPAPKPEHKLGYSCPGCGEVLPSAERAKRARHWTLIWAYLGLTLLIPAFILPMLIIEQPDVRIEAGFLESLEKLWQHGDKFIAAVVGIASGVLPIVKLVVLICLASGLQFDRHRHRRLYKLLEFTGNWSMTDVQLVSMGLFWWRGSVLYSLDIGPGVSYFIGMIFVTKMATMAYQRVVDWRNHHGS